MSLAKTLAKLYPREADQRRVVGESGLDASLIAFDPSAINSWSEILRVAALRKATERILSIAIEEFPEVDFVERKVPVEGPKLEKIVQQRAQFVDVRAWRTKLARCESAVCRVEVERDGMWKAGGTGFLVGRDLVLTNHHVVDLVLAKSAPATKMRFKFEFYADEEGSPSAGTIFEPASDDLEGAIVASSPPSEADEKPDGAVPGKPAENELDFALVRLKLPAGTIAIGSTDPNAAGEKRGWLELKADSAELLVDKGTDLFVLQHPSGEPMKLTFGNVLDVKPLRLRYDANTLPGSSGSPCLDAKLQVVALHHAGDAAHPQFSHAEYNQGIPIHRIVATCKAQNVTFDPPPKKKDA